MSSGRQCKYGVPNFVAMVVLVLGGFFEDGARVAMWIVSILIVVWSTVRAGRGDWVMRPGHFAERHGLIIIVALGEVIVALGNAVAEPLNDGESFSGTAVVALAGTGVAAGILWWSYFDRVQPALEHRAEETRLARSRTVRPRRLHVRPRADRRRCDPDRGRSRGSGAPP